MSVVGCYYHGHDCFLTKHLAENKEWQDKKQKLQQHLETKIDFLESLGYRVVQMRECQFHSERDQNPDLKRFINLQQPRFYQEYPKRVSEQCILDGVSHGSLFGMLLVDIEVEQNYLEFWNEYSPLFCNTNVPFEAIGETMQEFWTKLNTRPDGSVKPFPETRLLVGGLRCSKILLSSELLRWYLHHGLRVTKIYEVIYDLCSVGKTVVIMMLL